jgi:hypothetical protein
MSVPCFHRGSIEKQLDTNPFPPMFGWSTTLPKNMGWFLTSSMMNLAMELKVRDEDIFTGWRKG